MLDFIFTIIRITLIVALIYLAKKLFKTISRKIMRRTKKTSIFTRDDSIDYTEESQISSIFVGIVDGDEPDSISIGIIDTNRQTVASKSFPLIETSLIETQTLLNENESISELKAIVDFLRSQILESQKVQVLMEIPSAVLDANSLYLKILLLLSKKGYCGFEVRFVEDKKRVQLGFQYLISYDQEKIPVTYLVPEEARLTAQVDPGVIYLQKDMSQAYAQFLLGSSPSSECAASFAALIAKNKNLYYFLNSEGQVQSSQDLLEFMKNHEEGYPTAVIAGSEVFMTLKLPITEQDKIEKIPLKYAIAQKQYKFLGENNALKFALLNVCRLWKIRLYCLSWHDEDGAKLLNYEVNFLNPDEEDFFKLPERYVIYEPSDDLGLVESNALLASIKAVQSKDFGSEQNAM